MDASTIVTGLLTGQGPVIGLFFGFLLSYFIYDIIKKFNKAEEVTKLLGEMNITLVGIKSALDTQQTLMIVLKKDLEELQNFSRTLSHRVVALETINQLHNMKTTGQIP